jgi:L-ascorbate metabolism protein UlaG (beta-lactamase superfamily)
VRITKYTHACVRLEADRRILVIDPGEWSELDALDRADAVLVTHQHYDHVDPLRLAGLGVPVFAPAGAEIEGPAITRVTSGQTFEAAGFRVEAVGARHAITYGGQPDCANLGYVVEGAVYHPGDALHVPDRPIETLLVPAHAPWLKLAEAIDFVRAVRPQRTFPIHDAMLGEKGRASVNAWIGRETDAGFRYLQPGETVP